MDQRSNRRSPFVIIMILTWNHLERTLNCLQSLDTSDYPAGLRKTVVVDNASTDDTVATIRKAFPQIDLLVNSTNLGYAAGNNAGLRYVLDRYQPKYIFVLNNDVVLDRYALSNLVAAGEENPDAGFLGPKIYQSDQPQVLQSAGTIVTKWGRTYQIGLDQLDQGQFDVQRAVDSLVGCATLISVDTLERIGLLDERFYLYHEDTDWCIRARKADFKVLYVPTAKVWHRSSNIRESDLSYMKYYMTRNSFLMLRKNGFGVLAILRELFQQLIWLVNWTVNPKWKHKKGQRDAILKALFDALIGRYGKQASRFGR